jgi:ATP/maltotriose-dependent transcriptional regulator MalT
LIEPLSPRELDVLRLKASGAVNQRISEELVVGVPAVKSHANSIFRKLGGQSRSEAIARARDLRLLAA